MDYALNALPIDYSNLACERLIEVSFAKILNAKHEKGGAKLHKNLLVLKVLHKARDEHRNRAQLLRSVSPVPPPKPVPITEPVAEPPCSDVVCDMPLFSPFESTPLVTSPLSCGVEFVADPSPDPSFYSVPVGCSTLPPPLISPLQYTICMGSHHTTSHVIVEPIDHYIATDLNNQPPPAIIHNDDVIDDDDLTVEQLGHVSQPTKRISVRHDSDSGISSGDSRSGSDESDSDDSEGSISPPPIGVGRKRRRGTYEQAADASSVNMLICAFNSMVGVPAKQAKASPTVTCRC